MLHSRLLGSSIRATQNTLPRISCRYKSITAAIERGRQGDTWTDRPSRRDDYRGGTGRRRRTQFSDRPRPRPLRPDYSGPRRGYNDEYYGDVNTRPAVRPYERRDSRDNNDSFSTRKDSDHESGIHSLPYTTAATEFIYGHSSVFAALKSGRRKLYKLYVHARGREHQGGSALIAWAKSFGVPIEQVGDDYLPAMDRASAGRPHNVSTPVLPMHSVY